MAKRTKKKKDAIRRAEIFIIDWLKTEKGVLKFPNQRLALVMLAEKSHGRTPPEPGQPRCKAGARLVDLMRDIKGLSPAKGPLPPSKSVDKVSKFMKSAEWKRCRYDALKKNNGCCELCGRSKHDGIVLNVDHIKPVRMYWHLRADLDNLQVLCSACNWGKGNRDNTDWREPSLKTLMGEQIETEERENG